MASEKGDIVSAPEHYCKGRMYQTWEVANDWGLDKDAYLFNALKYISRAGRKSYPGMTLEQSMEVDLRKARAYIDRKIVLMHEAGGPYRDIPMKAPDMPMGEVIRLLKAYPDRRYARRGWNGKGMWISLQRPDKGSRMTVPYIYMSTAQGGLVPWLASQTDMLADDWYEVPKE